MRVLGIETTCDETGAAVVEGDPSTDSGLKVLSNIVASSVDLQKKYGGVVPEVAAREQVRVIIPVIEECLSTMADRLSINDKRSFSTNKRLTINEIDAIAVAHGPGLIGSLLIGVETAKALAIAWNKPLVAVNHLIGHIYASWLGEDKGDRGDKGDKGIGERALPEFPLIALVVSGGHTDLVLMTRHGKFKLLGSTLDDAAGEAFDKVARVLGLGYPGGPEIERLASQLLNSKHQISNIKLPRPMIDSMSLDFSFSGLKTAVVNLVHSTEIVDHRRAAIAREFQKAVVEVLVAKTIKAAQKFGARAIVVGGGVAANTVLRSEFIDHSKKVGIDVYFPSKAMSVDNGAMIAAAAFYKLNFKKVDPLKLAADPSLHF